MLLLQDQWFDLKRSVTNTLGMLKQDKLFSFFLFSVIIGVGLSYSVVYLFHLVSAYMVIYYGLGFIRQPAITHLKQPTPFYLFFFFLVGWFLLSTLWAEDKLAALRFSSHLMLGSLIALSVSWYVKSITQLKYVLMCVVLFLALEIIVALLEIFTTLRWPISRYSFLLPYFGRPLYLTPDWLSELLKKDTPQYLFSFPTGFQWNPNNLSAVMCLLFPYTLIMRNPLLKFSFTVSILTIVVAASSRLCFMALCLIFILYFFLLASKKEFLNWLLLLLFCFLVTDGFYAFPNNKKLSEIALVNQYQELWPSTSVEIRKHGWDLLQSNPELGGDDSTSMKVRVILLKRGWQLFKDRPWLGIGAGNSKSFLAAQGGVGAEKINDLHCFWLELLVDGGVFFCLVFAVWYLLLMRQLFVAGRDLHDEFLGSLSLASCIGLLGFSIAGISPSSAGYLLPMYLFFGICLALINLSCDEEQRRLN